MSTPTPVPRTSRKWGIDRPGGAVICWSESSCVVYANSVLGARCNRTPAILDIFSNIAGCTPEFGLLTEDGRMATWRVDLDLKVLPDPQVLGAAIAQGVIGDVPYVVGLDVLLGQGMTTTADDYLKEMGAACAAVGGAVALMHVEGITPEANDYGRGLLRSDCRQLTIDSDTIARLTSSYRRASQDVPRAERCVIGCTHLSYAELTWWVDTIETRVAAPERRRAARAAAEADRLNDELQISFTNNDFDVAQDSKQALAIDTVVSEGVSVQLVLPRRSEKTAEVT